MINFVAGLCIVTCGILCFVSFRLDDRLRKIEKMLRDNDVEF